MKKGDIVEFYHTELHQKVIGKIRSFGFNAFDETELVMLEFQNVSGIAGGWVKKTSLVCKKLNNN